MSSPFIDFWRLYAPRKVYANRYRACERLWLAIDENRRSMIMRDLRREQTERSPPRPRAKNPYFYLIDWEPPQPHWLTPAQTGHLLGQGIPLAVCCNPQTNRFGTVTRDEAQQLQLEVHHYM